MKLGTVHVTNSGEFQVGLPLCLVGKNEAVKTAIMPAMARLNPHPPTPVSYDLEPDYPGRWLKEYEERQPLADASNSQQLIAALAGIKERTQKEQGLLERVSSYPLSRKGRKDGVRELHDQGWLLREPTLQPVSGEIFLLTSPPIERLKPCPDE